MLWLAGRGSKTTGFCFCPWPRAAMTGRKGFEMGTWTCHWPRTVETGTKGIQDKPLLPPLMGLQDQRPSGNQRHSRTQLEYAWWTGGTSGMEKSEAIVTIWASRWQVRWNSFVLMDKDLQNRGEWVVIPFSFLFFFLFFFSLFFFNVRGKLQPQKTNPSLKSRDKDYTQIQHRSTCNFGWHTHSTIRLGPTTER